VSLRRIFMHNVILPSGTMTIMTVPNAQCCDEKMSLWLVAFCEMARPREATSPLIICLLSFESGRKTIFIFPSVNLMKPSLLLTQSKLERFDF